MSNSVNNVVSLQPCYDANDNNIYISAHSSHYNSNVYRTLRHKISAHVLLYNPQITA